VDGEEGEGGGLLGEAGLDVVEEGLGAGVYLAGGGAEGHLGLVALGLE